MIDIFGKEFEAPFHTIRTPNLGPPIPRSEVPASVGEKELARLQSSVLIVAYHGFFQATWVAEIMLKQNLLEPPVPKASLRRPEQGINTSESHKVNHSHLLCSSNIQAKVWDSAVSVYVSSSGFIYTFLSKLLKYILRGNVEILFESFPRPSLLWLQNDQSWSQNISIITFNGCNLLFVEVIRCNVQGLKKNSVGGWYNFCFQNPYPSTEEMVYLNIEVTASRTYPPFDNIEKATSKVPTIPTLGNFVPLNSDTVMRETAADPLKVRFVSKLTKEKAALDYDKPLDQLFSFRRPRIPLNEWTQLCKYIACLKNDSSSQLTH
ncbi:hypothetical protein Cgig2_018295 [Carnegiea gigantea]|uniref:Uncharacterized protein n=1 Tax=Carnegiea gigantea TaxID=171969 RepID=A0A9Q1KVH7_9CARY|nr:hypothetical protein Cgig2_018295 [Carnegiea gigantea]